jgi:hypothetical protein
MIQWVRDHARSIPCLDLRLKLLFALKPLSAMTACISRVFRLTNEAKGEATQFYRTDSLRIDLSRIPSKKLSQRATLVR